MPTDSLASVNLVLAERHYLGAQRQALFDKTQLGVNALACGEWPLRSGSGIAYSIMNRSKLAKLRREHASMRLSPQRARDLEGLAQRLGRKQVKRGKEPMWESQYFPQLFPVSIPHHGGKDLKNPTKNQILANLENDLEAWDDWIQDHPNGDEEN